MRLDELPWRTIETWRLADLFNGENRLTIYDYNASDNPDYGYGIIQFEIEAPTKAKCVKNILKLDPLDVMCHVHEFLGTGEHPHG
jgi:hypothetical protein